jgi:periplasmic copper chaperone A
MAISATLRRAAPLLIALFMARSFAQGDAAQAGDLRVSGAWSRPTPPAAVVGVVYFSIANLGSQEDLLIGLSSPIATQVELHESQRSQGVESMRAVTAVSCPPRTIIRAAPGALHVMLLGLAHPLLAGTSFPLTLKFRDAGAVTLQVSVENCE